MRIPLDYYRILGLPIQATVEQLKQAHRDRTLQLPRREYSEIAIEARKSLIDEAYKLLSNPRERQAYDAEFLARAATPAVETPTAIGGDDVSSEVGEQTLRSLAADSKPLAVEPYTPTIEVGDAQFVGALLILLELGEYELVIRLGRPFLSSGQGTLADGRYGDPPRVLEDIVLTLALSCLELGREQWQQRQYESAAESLETGQELLAREQVLPAIRAEIQSDLYKLRPYRVLELVARPLDHTADRQQGTALLKGMLRDRGGIEGADDDLSGLSTDDFLRFIQQLRSYLTAAEQQEIFEAEARRPSAVATYLAVYALLARGFAFHQPALIQRARQLLRRLGTQQDVHLEQAVCALLLGQAEEADRALDLSQEYEPLAFIREHSQSAPDLLPGLCLYAERWLREEIFTHFRDLANQQTALKDYFADTQVQAYLEAMPLARAVETQPVPAPEAAYSAPGLSNAHGRRSGAFSMNASAVPLARQSAAVPADRPLGDGLLTSTEVVATERSLSIAERVSQLSPDGQLQGETTRPSAHLQNGHRSQPPTPGSPEPPPRRSRSPRWDRLTGILIAAIFATGLLGFATVRTLSWLGNVLGGPRLQKPTLNLNLGAPPIAIPVPPPPEAQIGVSDIAAQVVDKWLGVKRQALSENHNVDILDTVLVPPALAQWQNRAQGAQRDNWHASYDHTLEILTVEPEDPSAEQLVATARVREVAEYYEFGIRNLSNSYDETLTMQYTLIRQNGDWFVEEIAELD